MPRLSDSMSEATIVAWLKQPGETFHRGEPLVEVETDKATVVYEAEADGLLAEILVSEGVSAALGEPIARLGGKAGDAAPATGGAAQANGPSATSSSRLSPRHSATTRPSTRRSSTGAASATVASTSGSPSRPRTRSSYRPC